MGCALENLPRQSALFTIRFCLLRCLMMHVYCKKLYQHIKTQFVTDDYGKKLAVILPIKDYQKMLDDLEEIEDIKLYDEVKARKQKAMPFAEYLEKRKQKK